MHLLDQIVTSVCFPSLQSDIESQADKDWLTFSYCRNLNVCAKVTEDEGKTLWLHMKGKIRCGVFLFFKQVPSFCKKKNKLDFFGERPVEKTLGCRVWETIFTLTMSTLLQAYQICIQFLISWFVRVFIDHVNRTICHLSSNENKRITTFRSLLENFSMYLSEHV